MSAPRPLTDPTAVQRPASFGERLRNQNAIWVLGILIVILVIFSAIAPTTFATPFNFRNIAIDSAVLLVVAVGETFVIITSGIDLSVGSVLVFAGVASAATMGAMGGQQGGVGAILTGLLVAVIAGIVWGLINGFLVAKAKIPPLIVTLGTMGAALGFAEIFTGGVDQSTVPTLLSNSVGVGLVAGIPILVLIAGIIAAVGALVLHTTRFGRHTLAVGSNLDAAKRFGVNVDWHLLRVYALAGLLSGLAGYLALARFSTTTINGHATDNLNAIAAVVIGGTSLFGGRGSVTGTIVGVVIPVTLLNGFTVLGVSPFWRDVAVGVVLIVAVYIDIARRKRLRQE